MVKKTRAKKYRGVGRTHGRGSKAGRGKGLRGGSGRAGLHKHKFATTVILEKQGFLQFGRHGFTRHAKGVGGKRGPVLNVRDLAAAADGKKKIDLTALGYEKLLGGGSVSTAFDVTVPTASGSAVAKIEAAGGSVTQSELAASEGDA
jgi:large subunit ribosomal protein L15